jgi:DNA-binding Xre family transcriptional regulator
MLNTECSASLKRLSQGLANKEITQKDLELATGVHQSQISRIMSGKVCRVSKNVMKLCRYAESLGPVSFDQAVGADNIARALKPLLNKSVAEDHALLGLVESLLAWRVTWEAKP